MTPIPGKPRSILIATDLSARCDRALDRAVALSAAWQSELVAVHAIETGEDLLSALPERNLPSWKRGPEATKVAAEYLRRDVGFPVATVVEEGEPARVILDAAAANGCGLIVVAAAKDELLGRFALGATVDTLLREAEVPVLVVRQRARRPYERIVVAADASDASLGAVRAAAGLFADHGFDVFHAYEAPLSGMLGDPGDYREAFGEVSGAALDTMLKAAALPAGQLIDVVVERGNPADLIPQYVRTKAADLVVMGTEGRGVFLELLLGSTAKSILAGLDCDALVVPRKAAPASAED